MLILFSPSPAAGCPLLGFQDWAPVKCVVDDTHIHAVHYQKGTIGQPPAPRGSTPRKINFHAATLRAQTLGGDSGLD